MAPVRVNLLPQSTVETPTAASRWRSLGRTLADTSARLISTGRVHRHYLNPVLNGAVGDKLARTQHALAIPTSWRQDGRDCEAQDLHIPANSHAVVFVHGLMADEVCFSEPLPGTAGPLPYLMENAKAGDIVPLCVRFNSGRHISENGREIGELLSTLLETHGEAITQLTLIGHSMGGLVLRSACHYGLESGQPWVSRVANMVLLGTPNDGAWLEQVSHLTSRVLRGIFSLHTQIIARVIDERSDGIKDLRHGVIVDEDWQESATSTRATRTSVPPLAAPTMYWLAGGSLWRDAPEDPTSTTRLLLSRFFGDGQVGPASALGRDSRLPPPERLESRLFVGASHFGLLADPRVHEWLAAALDPTTKGGTPRPKGSKDS